MCYQHDRMYNNVNLIIDTNCMHNKGKYQNT